VEVVQEDLELVLHQLLQQLIQLLLVEVEMQELLLQLQEIQVQLFQLLQQVVVVEYFLMVQDCLEDLVVDLDMQGLVVQEILHQYLRHKEIREDLAEHLLVVQFRDQVEVELDPLVNNLHQTKVQ
jgi:hypothetical protein